MSTAPRVAVDTRAAGSSISSRGSFQPEQSPWQRFKGRFDTKVVPYLLISPFFILFAVFGIFPLIYNGIVSFRRWNLKNPTNDGWAGFDNYTKLFSDGFFANALVNTFGIFLLSTIPQLLLALFVASLLNRRLRAQTLFRVGVLVPFVTPIVASSLVFAYVFSKNYGLANSVLGMFGIQSEAAGTVFNGIDWRATKWASWVAIATMVNWKWVGYNALLYLAAMQSIPKDVYEAAALDGATPWQQLWRITVPMIRPMVIFTVVLSTIGGLQLFTEPMLFGDTPDPNGGALRQWQTVGQLIYQTGWVNLNLGYAAAMSWALFLIIVVIAGFNAWLTSRIGQGGSTKR
jgi:cellobiose transport system permease protein